MNFVDYCTTAGAGGKYEGMKIAELRADILSNSSTDLPMNLQSSFTCIHSSGEDTRTFIPDTYCRLYIMVIKCTVLDT